jgi:ATP-dependent DNA helicase RecG
MELVEQLGSGVPRILKSYGRECFLFSDNFIRMTFPAKGVHNVTENVTEKRLLDILKIINRNSQITTEKIANHLGVTKRTILRDIDKLKELGILHHIGSAKGGYWEIKEDKNPANK